MCDKVAIADWFAGTATHYISAVEIPAITSVDCLSRQ